jgi:allantoin racemase
MKLLVVNPNSTAAMTDKVARSLRPFAAPGTEITFANPAATPASIEGHHDEATSVPAMLDIVAEAERQGNQGTVVACFDDPGIGAAREIASGPVIGICEAAMQAASILAARFSVVTTLPRSVPIIEDLALRYGMERRCRRVHAADIAVLALEHDPDARMIVRDAVRRAVALHPHAGTYVEFGDEGHGSNDIEQKVRTFTILADYLERVLDMKGPRAQHEATGDC